MVILMIAMKRKINLLFDHCSFQFDLQRLK